jgi:hypothetical protein
MEALYRNRDKSYLSTLFQGYARTGAKGWGKIWQSKKRLSKNLSI